MLERRRREIELIEKRYGAVEVAPDQSWVLILQFALPEGWTKTQTELLVPVPPGYPTTPPDNFYTDNDLKLASGATIGNSSPDQNVFGKVMRQFSFHIEAEWRANADLFNGHNLLTFLLGVEDRVTELS